MINDWFLYVLLSSANANMMADLCTYLRFHNMDADMITGRHHGRDLFRTPLRSLFVSPHGFLSLLLHDER
jgi:hypothetical protein